MSVHEHGVKTQDGGRHLAVCFCGWQSTKTYTDAALADAVGQEHVALATSNERRCAFEAELERRAAWDAPQNAVCCPECGSDNLREWGYVGYASSGALTAEAEGAQWIEDGVRTDLDDAYYAHAIVCRDCHTEVCTVGIDPYANDTAGLEARVSRELRLLHERAAEDYATAPMHDAARALACLDLIEAVCDAWDELRGAGEIE